MNTKLIKLAIDQLSTLEKFTEESDNTEGIAAMIANIKATLTLVTSTEK